MRKLYLCAFSVLLCLCAFASSSADIARLNDTAESLLNQNPKRSLELAAKAKVQAEASDDKKQIAYATVVMGVANYKVDAYEKARSLITTADSIYQSINDTSGLAFCKYWMGNLKLNKGAYAAAFDLFQTAYDLSEKSGDKKNLVRSLDGRASIYEILNDDNRALELYTKVLQLAKEANFKAWYPTVMFSLGNLAYRKGKLDEAIDKYNEAIKLSDEVGNLNNKANCYQRLASIYYDKKDARSAMQYTQQAMDLFRQTGSMSSFSYGRLQMCYVLLADKEYNTAIDLALLSFEEGKNTGELELQKNAAEVLYYAYLNKGDKGKALDYHIKFHNLAEASHTEELSKKLAQMDLQANFEKEREVARAEEDKHSAEMNAQIDKQRLIKKVSIIGVFMLAVIAGLAVFAFNQKRKDNTLLALEKERSDDLLLTILPNEIVEEIKASNFKENKLASVFFANLKSYKGTAENKTPSSQPPVDADKYFKGIEDIIARHNIEKIRTVGDAYLCMATAKATDEENAQEILQTAIEMQQYIAQLKAEKTARGEVFFDIRIGVHTGPVVAGIIGIRKYSFDIWGDTVNVAARLEQHGEDGKINISGSTYALIKNRFLCMLHGEVETRKGEKVEMYFATGNQS